MGQGREGSGVQEQLSPYEEKKRKGSGWMEDRDGADE